MNDSSLSHTLLPGNDCFGCGPMNPHGLNITVRLDPENANRIVAEFNPQNHMTGFPGITHGGVIYTALDCMATWSGMVLRKTKAIWILRSASMKYHRPAFQGRPLALSAVIASQSDDAWQAIEVHTEARDTENNLLAEGNFKVIPLPPDKFMALTSIAEMPQSWANWLHRH